MNVLSTKQSQIEKKFLFKQLGRIMHWLQASRVKEGFLLILSLNESRNAGLSAKGLHAKFKEIGSNIRVLKRGWTFLFCNEEYQIDITTEQYLMDVV